jgi:hypothetical protein
MLAITTQTEKDEQETKLRDVVTAVRIAKVRLALSKSKRWPGPRLRLRWLGMVSVSTRTALGGGENVSSVQTCFERKSLGGFGYAQLF